MLSKVRMHAERKRLLLIAAKVLREEVEWNYILSDIGRDDEALNRRDELLDLADRIEKVTE